MAEVLGVLASGVAVTQLATAIVSGAQKLRRIWCELRDAPQDILQIVEELEILGQFLVFLQESLNSSPTDSGPKSNIERTIELSSNAARDLDDIVSKLYIEPDVDVGKRQKLKLRVQTLLHKGEIDKIRERLRGDARYLNLAINCYTMSVLPCQSKVFSKRLGIRSMQFHQMCLMKNMTFQTLTSRVKDQNKLIPLSARGKDVEEMSSGRGKLFRKSYRSWGLVTCIRECRSQLPPWRRELDAQLSNNDDMYEEWKFMPLAWLKVLGVSICWNKSLGNWRYSLSPIRIVGIDSAIFRACAAGDIGEMTNLLISGTATLSDISEEGETLLHVGPLVICLLAGRHPLTDNTSPGLLLVQSVSCVPVAFKTGC